jgi:putative DNA-invertase from lambdoid prophage Rac
MSDLSSRCLAGNRVAIYARVDKTLAELLHTLRRTVEHRGGMVVAVYLDDADITGSGKFAAWHQLVTSLGTMNKIVVIDAGDLPGKRVADLLKVLALLRDRGVTLHLLDLSAGTMTGEVIDIIAAYRRAKVSQSIRAGQAKARSAGRRIGRPPVPTRVQSAIRNALADGGGTRSTARRYGVSPAFVANVRRAMAGAPSCTFC